MATESKTIDPKAKAYFESIGLNPEAAVAIRSSDPEAKKRKEVPKVYTMVQICEGYLKAMQPDPEKTEDAKA